MKNFNFPLTEYEFQVLKDLLCDEHLCDNGCYCGYKDESICYKQNNKGEYKCKLTKALSSIMRKMGNTLAEEIE